MKKTIDFHNFFNSLFTPSERKEIYLFQYFFYFFFFGPHHFFTNSYLKRFYSQFNICIYICLLCFLFVFLSFLLSTLFLFYLYFTREIIEYIMKNDDYITYIKDGILHYIIFYFIYIFLFCPFGTKLPVSNEILAYLFIYTHAHKTLTNMVQIT